MRDYGTTNNTPAHQAPPVWRAPEGLEDLTAAQVGDGGACQHTNDKPDRSGAPRGLRGLAAVPVGDGGAAPLVWRTPEGPAAVLVGGGRAWPGFEIDHSERSSRVAISRAGRRPPAHTAARPNKTGHAAARDLSGQRTTRSRPAPQGPGGSRIRPLGGHQRSVQRIWVPVAPRRSQASTTRAAMPASADLPHVRGSYCFLMPTSPSILRTPS